MKKGSSDVAHPGSGTTTQWFLELPLAQNRHEIIEIIKAPMGHLWYDHVRPRYYYSVSRGMSNQLA
jgi:hypothetical protein